MIADVDGFRWVVDGGDDYLGPAPHEASFEPIVRALMPQDGRWVLDIGAHVGHWALRMTRWTDSRIMAFEPTPPTFGRLWDNVALNRLATQITTVACAAWDTRALLPLDPRWHLAGPEVAYSGSMRVTGIYGDDPGDAAGLMVVPAMPLDLLLPNIVRVGFVKVDVEGAEYRVLLGAHNLLVRDHPVIFLEMHHELEGVDRDLLENTRDLLVGMGYGIQVVGHLGESEYWLCQA